MFTFNKETTFAVSLSRIKQSLEVSKHKADLEISIQDVDRSECIPKQLCQDVPEARRQQEHRFGEGTIEIMRYMMMKPPRT